MKRLVESIFGDNVKNSVNTTDLRVAANLITQSIESKIKLKSEWIDGSAKDPDIWDAGWYLCRVNPDEFTEVIYLQYTENIIGSYEDVTTAIRLRVNIEKDFDKDELYIDGLGIDVFEKFNYLASYHILQPQTFEKWTSLKDAYLTSNFEGILKYLTDTFWRFKQLAEHGMTFEDIKKKTVEHYFEKYERKRSKIEDEITKELNKVSKTIIK